MLKIVKMNITVIVFASCILSTAQALVAYYAIYKNSDTDIITECQYIWWYTVGSGIQATLQSLFSLYTVLCFLLMSENRKKRPLRSHLTGMVILVIAGGFIKGRINDSCKEMYMTKYAEIWKCFNITFWYAVTILCLFAVVTLIIIFYRCFCNHDQKAVNDKLVSENAENKV